MPNDEGSFLVVRSVNEINLEALTFDVYIRYFLNDSVVYLTVVLLVLGLQRIIYHILMLLLEYVTMRPHIFFYGIMICIIFDSMFAPIIL